LRNHSSAEGNQESVEEASDEERRKPQRDKNGNEDPAATPLEETEYYEEGNGGATD
jgi:hypothetical protein